MQQTVTHVNSVATAMERVIQMNCTGMTTNVVTVSKNYGQIRIWRRKRGFNNPSKIVFEISPDSERGQRKVDRDKFVRHLESLIGLGGDVSLEIGGRNESTETYDLQVPAQLCEQ